MPSVAPTGVTRGEVLEWKTYGHDDPAVGRALAACGFSPDRRAAVLVGSSAELATAPGASPGVTIRSMRADADLERIAAMEGAIWGGDWSWLPRDLSGRLATDPSGVLVLAAEASTASAPILRQLGFATITEATTYVWTPPGVTIAGAP